MNKPLPRDDLLMVLNHTRGLWENLRGKRIFVSGATGFFGRWLLETFVLANDQLSLDSQLIALTRNPDKFRTEAPHIALHSAIILWKGDVRHFQFPEDRVTHVIHAAAAYAEPPTDPEMLDTLIEGTRRMLDFATSSGTRRFLFVSSGVVYGVQPSGLDLIPETHVPAGGLPGTASAYAKGKLAGEALCMSGFRECNLETTIARCFAFVGPGLQLNSYFAIGNFIRDALAGNCIHVTGDGTPLRSYLYAADLAVWLWTLLLRGQPGSIYNVGSEQARTIAELAHITASVLKPGLSVLIEREPGHAGIINRYVPSTRKAREELGLAETIELEDAIRRTATWLKNTPLS